MRGSRKVPWTLDFVGWRKMLPGFNVYLFSGKLIMQRNLEWPQNDRIPNALVDAFKDAMTNGNKIHDDLFDLSPVNVEVDDAVVMAGEECGVQTMPLKRRNNCCDRERLLRHLQKRSYICYQSSSQEDCARRVEALEGQSKSTGQNSAGQDQLEKQHDDPDDGITMKPPGPKKQARKPKDPIVKVLDEEVKKVKQLSKAMDIDHQERHGDRPY
ncbi:hypothetical protein QZH41_002599 [Actinostola sp. cb2023]|nr:hypothetical protein QZH41_002599 [Actinostola sp. cb2023]